MRNIKHLFTNNEFYQYLFAKAFLVSDFEFKLFFSILVL